MLYTLTFSPNAAWQASCTLLTRRRALLLDHILYVIKSRSLHLKTLLL